MPFALALLIVLAGAAAGVPGVVALGIVATGFAAARALWLRTGSATVSYTRRLTSDRAVCGDEIGLSVGVRNRGPLPLPWVRTVDILGRGVAVHRRVPEGVASTPPEATRGELVGGWTLGPFEAAVRHFVIATTRRGAYELGPSAVSAGDLLGRPLPVHEVESRIRYVVRPRMVGVRGLDDARDWEGERRARVGLVEDPSRYAGLRAYRPGDPIRRIHWRASARTGRTLTRRFDPSRRQDVLLALDLRVPRGPAIGAAERDEATEGLVVATMSLARSFLADGAAVGLAVPGFAGGRRILYLPPNATEAGLELMADLLARLDAIPSMAFPRLLSDIARRVPPGTTIVTLGAVDPIETVPALRELRRAGFGVVHLAFGDEAAAFAGRASAAGIPARTARLDGPWATCTRLELGR
jgi:uncharacterized protein (DUF58 family)